MAAKKGRPSSYNDELAEKICAGIMAGYGLKKICSAEGFPHIATVFNWLTKPDHPFYDRYVRAREVQAEFMADELIELADDESKDVSGELQMPNSVAVQRSRLKVDTRKWVASKLLPKRYGDKVQAEVSGKDGGPVQFVISRVGTKQG